MKKREQEFINQFQKWLVINSDILWPGKSIVYEAKFCMGMTIPFSAIRKHQVQALQLAEMNKVIYKIPDSGFEQKPFDGFLITKALAFIIIKFYKKRIKTFYMIPISSLIKCLSCKGKKSLSQNDCLVFGKEYSL